MKIAKKQIHGKEARVAMLEGIKGLANVVGSTMGAKGRNVILDKEYGAPLVINDGVTIAKEIFFGDPVKDNAVQLIKDAAIRTNDLAGDGTTGATVLASTIVEKGWEAIDKGANPVMLRKEIDEATKKVLAYLLTSSVEVKTEKQVIQIAQISVQDDEVGKKIGELMYNVGPNGAVAIKNSIKPGVFVEKSGGMKVEGAVTGGMIDNPDKWESKMDNAKVLILEDSPEDHEFETKWIPLIRQFAEGKQDAQGNMQITNVNVPQLIVVAEKLSRRFIMAMNQNKNIIKWVWFRPTTAGKNMKEIYSDLQALVGGVIVNEEDGVFLNQIKVSDMGDCETVVADRHNCVFSVNQNQSKKDRFLDRCSVVLKQAEAAEDEIEKEQILGRYAALVGGVAEIRVAAATEQDTNELKLRIEDALNATRSAMEEGIVHGGGVALFNAVNVLKTKTDGEKILKEACYAPIRQILHNAGYDNIDQTLKELKNGEGVNVVTDQKVNMVDEGIIDPFKVVRLALVNATSVAGLLLTSEYTVTNEEDQTDAVREFFNPNK